jgi:hypothetical protein
MLCDCHKSGKRFTSAACDSHRGILAASTELHAGRARLQAELERDRAELEQARRPWWCRLWGG